MALLGRADNPPGYSPGPPNPFVDTPAPTATATVALPDSGAAVPDTRVNWSTYGAPSRERLDTDVYGGTTAGGYSGGGYPTIGRPLRDDEVPFNPSPGSPSGAAAAASPSDLYPGENPWAGEGRSAAATSASASASGTSLANVYDSRSNVAGSSSGDPYGRPYWDAGTGSNNIYAAKTTEPATPGPSSAPLFPLPSSTTTPSAAGSPKPAEKPAQQPKPRNKNPKLWTNVQTWILLVVVCASAGAGASGLILWNNFTFEQPSQASSALSLRVVAFLSFASLAGSGLLWLLSIFGDLCCLVPDVTLFSDGTQRYLRRRAPPVFFVDIKIAFSALFICAYLGSLIPYSVMAGGNGFYQLTCSSQAGTLARYCTSAKATLGLAAVAGGCWLVYLVWLVWQRRWAALEGGRSAIKGAV